MDLRIAGRFRVGVKLGNGSFGDIYEGTDLKTNDAVAIKLEVTNCKYPQLIYESKVYKLLNQTKGVIGVPQVKYVGVDGEFNVMVIDLLGPSLEELFTYCSRKLSLCTTLMIAEQLLQRIEYLHTKNMIHRDIKPDNFLMGNHANPSTVFIIDFGLSKRYCDPHTGQHIPYKDKKSMTGTARYASINTHHGIEQSRRDDLESIGYVLVYFLKGSLPWQGLKQVPKKDKFDQIAEVKQKVTVQELCRDCPKEFEQYLAYTRSMQFDEAPDYKRCLGYFTDLFQSEGLSKGAQYDWVLKYASDAHTHTHIHTHAFPTDAIKNANKSEGEKKDLRKKCPAAPAATWLPLRRPVVLAEAEAEAAVAACSHPKTKAALHRDPKRAARSQQKRLKICRFS